MFDANSRYASVDEATLTVRAPDGSERTLRYKRRRFLPSASSMTLLTQHTITEGDRLDNVTAMYLGEPTQFWRLCDANDGLAPDELTVVGRVVRIAMPL